MQKIGRAARAQWGSVEEVGVDQCGFYVAVVETFLNCLEILTPFQRAGGDRMAEAVTRGWPDDVEGEDCQPLHRVNRAGTQVMARALIDVAIVPAMVFQNHPWPAPPLRPMGIVAPQGVGKPHPPQAPGVVHVAPPRCLWSVSSSPEARILRRSSPPQPQPYPTRMPPPTFRSTTRRSPRSPPRPMASLTLFPVTPNGAAPEGRPVAGGATGQQQGEQPERGDHPHPGAAAVAQHQGHEAPPLPSPCAASLVAIAPAASC
jgi:hypothetical protein